MYLSLNFTGLDDDFTSYVPADSAERNIFGNIGTDVHRCWFSACKPVYFVT